MDNFQKIIGSNIRFLRKKQGVTQTQLAEMSDINYRHLQKIEAGTPDIRIGTICKISENLNIPACYILEKAEGCHDLQAVGLSCPRSLLDLMPLGVFACDLKDTIRYHNEVFSRTIGGDECGYVGHSLKSLIAHDDEYMQWVMALGQIEKEPDSFSGLTVHFIGPDKQLIRCQITQLKPLRTPPSTQKVTGYVGIISI